MRIMDILNSSKIKEENESLKKTFSELGGAESLSMVEIIKGLDDKKTQLLKSNEELIQQSYMLSYEIEQKKSQILVIDDDIAYESFALYSPKFSFTHSEEYRDKLVAVRNQQKEMIKKKTAAIGNQNWSVNGNKTQGKKMVNDMIKLVLRSFNNECDYCVDNIKFNTLDSNVKRINKSFDTLNNLGALMSVCISSQYKLLKLDELSLALEYQQKKQDEKEEQRLIREELKEQAKLEQEIKQIREKITKERKHFLKALTEIDAKLENSNDEEENLLLNAKKNELIESLAELDKEEALVDYRERNAKAGYVYIISNLGAFGENVFKIGMTRRLEPTDRIDELSSASVPFPFDIHAMVFSDNAPELEAKLHQHFSNNRINKISSRKEFFRADIKEIEKVIKENYDKVLDIVETSPADQYRQSLLIN